ncbi:MAG TPA: hypothetical protein VGO57_01275 [Verrucomicrobiae bacterium]|jgi:hypothetical protein
MRKHVQSILKLVCLILAVLVLWQLIAITRRVNPLHNITVPQLPTLTAKTNSTSNTHNTALNQPVTGSPTLGNLNRTNTQPSPATTTNSAGTNLVVSVPNTNGVTTNIVAKTTLLAVEKIKKIETNAIIIWQTNSIDVDSMKTVAATGTNAVSPSNATAHAIELVSASGHMPPMNRGGMMGFNPGGQHANLPPAIQAQIDKIFNSEIFGSVPHPMPMALIGIAGDVAFLRAPDGQSGMVKLGDSLGEIKLVRIGINRVLVEQDGQQKELTIFDGYGGESLLDKQGGTNNEIHK